MLVKCLGDAQWLKRGCVRSLDELWFAGPASTRRLVERNASWTASVDARLSSRVPARAHQPKDLKFLPSSAPRPLALLRFRCERPDWGLAERRSALGRYDCATVIVARVHAASSFSSAFASFRSPVSNPSVNHP